MLGVVLGDVSLETKSTTFEVLIADQVLRRMEFLHSLGLIHRVSGLQSVLVCLKRRALECFRNESKFVLSFNVGTFYFLP